MYLQKFLVIHNYTMKKFLAWLSALILLSYHFLPITLIGDGIAKASFMQEFRAENVEDLVADQEDSLIMNTSEERGENSVAQLNNLP